MSIFKSLFKTRTLKKCECIEQKVDLLEKKLETINQQLSVISNENKGITELIANDGDKIRGLSKNIDYNKKIQEELSVKFELVSERIEKVILKEFKISNDNYSNLNQLIKLLLANELIDEITIEQ